MDSIRVSEAPDPGSIPGEATTKYTKAGITNKNLILVLFPVFCIYPDRYGSVINKLQFHISTKLSRKKYFKRNTGQIIYYWIFSRM